jgi:hypothetical protein
MFLYVITSLNKSAQFIKTWPHVIPFIITQNFANQVKTREDTSILDLRKMTLKISESEKIFHR